MGMCGIDHAADRGARHRRPRGRAGLSTVHDGFEPYDEQDRRTARGYAGGILTLEDLQRYRTEVRPEIEGLRRQLADVEVRETVLAAQLGHPDAMIGYRQQVRSTVRSFSVW